MRTDKKRMQFAVELDGFHVTALLRPDGKFNFADIIDRLERAGFVERVRDSADRRRVNLVPTEKIRAVQERYAASELSAQLADVARGFTSAELKTVLRWFTALNAATH